jgi:uncharacterized protein (DUF4415 family)
VQDLRRRFSSLQINMLANAAFACCVLSHAPSRWPDWKRVDALTDEDITQAIAEDPDTFEPEPEWLQRAMILRPGQPKIRVTAYFDQEVVKWFRAQGRGYQTRMNAVLRAYMEGVRKSPPSPHRS